jgi:hypothetical protein
MPVFWTKSFGVALSMTVLVASGCSKTDTSKPDNRGASENTPVSSAAPATVLLSGDPCAIVDKATDAVNTVDHATMITTTTGGGAPLLGEARLVGGKSYVQVNGKWRLSPSSPSEMAAMVAEQRKTTKETCKAMGDETLDGVATAKFSAMSKTMAR